jgi:hypothetical protein
MRRRRCRDQERAGPAGQRGHQLDEVLVDVWYGPAAVLEPAVAVLIATARCLQDAIQGHKRGHQQFSHVISFALTIRHRW